MNKSILKLVKANNNDDAMINHTEIQKSISTITNILIIEVDLSDETTYFDNLKSSMVSDTKLFICVENHQLDYLKLLVKNIKIKEFICIQTTNFSNDEEADLIGIFNEFSKIILISKK